MSEYEPNPVSGVRLSAERERMRFSLRDLFVLTAICGVLLAIALPFVQQAREQARQNHCSSHMKILGLGLQNFHDVHRRFPAVSNQANVDGEANVGLMPGSGSAATRAGFRTTPGTASGYSWIVMILPYLEEIALTQSIETASQNYTLDGWSSSKSFDFLPTGGQHVSTVPLDEVICPSYGGPMISTASSGIPSISVAGYTLPATGYGPFYDATTSPPRGVQITNYVALSATTSLNMPNPKTADGVLIPGEGLNMKKILDGTSKTLMVCETKEPAFSSWYDGTTAWTTATPAGTQLTKGTTWPTKGFPILPVGEVCSLQCGPGCLRPDGTPRLYAPAGYTTAGFSGQSGSIAWGPSSDHSGGVVMHLAADASAHQITTDIDPTLYIELVTRAGGEPIVIPDRN